MKLTRRSLFQAAGLSVCAISIPVLPGCSVLPALPTFTAPDDETALTWLQLTAEGKIRFISPRQEIGQGISVGLKQIIAEELGLSPAIIDIKMLSTNLVSAVKSTVGSESIVLFAEPTARAAASLRELLKSRGAAFFRVDAATVVLTDDGLASGNKRVTFAQLAQGVPVVLSDEQLFTGPLRTFEGGQRRYVGKPMATEKILEIVTGAPLYAGDVHLKGMLYGGMARPEKLGAVLVAVTKKVALDLPGVVHVLVENNTVGVIAETPMALEEGIRALQIEWRIPLEKSQNTIDRALDLIDDEQDLEHNLLDEDIEVQKPWSCELNVHIPMAAHMCIETRTAVASAKEGVVEVWSGTQDPFFVRSAVSKALGVSKACVVVHSCRVGGSFGGNGYWADVDAAKLSKAIGRPVKVQWSRSENFQNAYHRPPSSHRLRIRVDDTGHISDWWHRFKSGYVVFTSSGMPPWLQRVTSLVGDFGVARGASPPYRLKRKKVEFSDVRIPVDTGPWRGLGAAPNSFVVESAMDAAARKIGVDPVQFRLKHIDDQRLSYALKRVALLAGWRNGDEKTGRGVACGIYKEMSYAAVIADVSLDSTTGVFTVSHLYCTHDCGLVINPDQVRAQVEGNFVWSIGMVKSERLALVKGRIDADYPGQYRIPTMRDIPPMTIELIEDGDRLPSGAGETAIVCAAAITNALSGLVDQSVKRLPVEPNFWLL